MPRPDGHSVGYDWTIACIEYATYPSQHTMIRFLTFSEEGLISVWDLSTERGKELRPFGAIPLVVVCASAESEAGSDEEEGEIRAKEFVGVSTSIVYLSSWGLLWD